VVVPSTLLIIFVLLYLIFDRLDEAALIMGTLPFALTGGIWALYLLGFNQSVATGVGHHLGWQRLGGIWRDDAHLPQERTQGTGGAPSPAACKGRSRGRAARSAQGR
jgi:hypothetical protein